MYKHIFGPVPSRRLGISLGIDLVPRKVCSLDCVYCEVGKTTKLTIDRQEYIKPQDIKKELKNYFENNPDPEYITFSGSGEPTLNIKIGEILEFIKIKKPHIPVAVLTNGTMLFYKSVRQEIKNADIVLPSLDAATQEVFNKINRPAQGLTIDKHIQGLIKFREEFTGKMWLEVFILPGYNNTEEEVIKLRKIIQNINPDLVQLNTLDRPGTVKKLQRANNSQIKQVIDMLGLKNIEIIASSNKRKRIKSYRKDIETAIIETIARRPCTIFDLIEILGLNINEINKYLDALDREGKIETCMEDRGIFYKLKEI